MLRVILLVEVIDVTLVDRLEKELLGKKKSTKQRKTILYARVSSHDQKLDLERQKQRLIKHCADNQIGYELISDLGSGLNYHKKGLVKLIHKIICGEVEQLIITHKDRLLRFGSDLLFKLCEFYGTKVTILEQSAKISFEQQLAEDVIEIMTVFTAKMYGKRAHKKSLLV